MLYNNLIYFLVSIFIFSTNTPSENTWLPFSLELAVLAAMVWSFSAVAGRMYRPAADGTVRFFRAEQKLYIIAVFYYIVFVYGLNLKTHLQPLSLNSTLPVLENIAGLAVFFLLLSQIWLKSRPAYERLFHRSYSPGAFIVLNIKLNLPIVLPWLVLSLAFDLLALLPFSSVRDILTSPWGDMLLFGVFICFLLFLFPPLVKWLWDCKPIPAGPRLDRINSFCRSQHFKVDVLNWPLFEGQVLTAGIMGIIPGLRYLLLTPSLLEALTDDELNSVLAHETGHIKKGHLLLYLLLFLGFSVLAGSIWFPLHHLILMGDLYYHILDWSSVSPEALLDILSAIVLLSLLLVYFRFIFGFFIRNFERQADACVFRAMGTAAPLIRSFEKIAQLSGTRREEKNWHHFGIGDRIDFLRQCEKNRARILRQDRKVHLSLLCYFAVIFCTVFWTQQFDPRPFVQAYAFRYAETVLSQRIRLEPGDSTWQVMLGNLLLEHKQEKQAIAAFEKALELAPANAAVNNNLAWLLLTAEDKSLKDPSRALVLARSATLINEKGVILDTLATAYWANGLIAEAVETETKAIRTDPANQKYYLRQIDTFRSSSWAEYTEKSGAAGHQEN